MPSRPRGPKPTSLSLTAAEQAALEQLVRRPSTPQQLAVRARIVLAAAAGRNHAQISRDLGISLDMARAWRRRWLDTAPETSAPETPTPQWDAVVARLRDLPRPGAPATITAEQYCHLMRLVLQLPETTGRPISDWSHRELANEAIAQGLVPTISPRHVGRFLKGV